MKFMQENGLKHEGKRNAFDQGDQYSFGRPVREIFGALEALSGQAFDEEELYGVFLGGVASQELQRHRLFQRTASKWADWWEQHWHEYVQDAAYSHVNLAAAKDNDDNPTGPKPGTHFKTVGGGSNHVLESVFDPTGKRVFYDLDTGRTAGLPAKWRDTKVTEAQLDEIVAWAAREGFDLMGTEYSCARRRAQMVCHSVDRVACLGIGHPTLEDGVTKRHGRSLARGGNSRP